MPRAATTRGRPRWLPIRWWRRVSRRCGLVGRHRYLY